MSLVGRYSSLPLNVSYRLSSDSNASVGSNPVLFFLLGTILKTKIPRHADLISQMYLSIELPDIVSDSVMSKTI